MNILLIHQYAGNKGDRAVAFAMCNMLKSIAPDANITISTSSPELWKGQEFFENNEIKFVPSSWIFEGLNGTYWALLRKIQKYTFTILRTCYLKGCCSSLVKCFVNPTFYEVAKNADVVISVGGHHFTTMLSRDLVSSINYDAMAVALIKKPLICFSQSFGQFKFYNKKNKKLTIKLLENCKALYAREPQSIDALKELGLCLSNVKTTYESVISLNKLFPNYVLPSKREKIIGIAIYAAQKREPVVHKSYIHSITASVNQFNKDGYMVAFFPMELKNTEPDDRWLIEEIITSVDNKEMTTYIDRDMPTLEHLQEVAKCQIFMGHKTHSTIFALATGTPLLGIAYHPKTRKFMSQFDVEEYCVDDSDLTTGAIIERYEKLLKNLDAIGLQLQSKAKEYSDTIYNDFEKAIIG